MAGGVDGFIIGSELVSLTRVRSGPGVYPAVSHLAGLAADVRGVVGPGPAIVYAADWTEYGAHVREGGAEVRFPLDPLWAHPAINAVGIDYYPPIADWRDGADHADLAETARPHDVDYLRRRLGAGEAFDWYYANAADRQTQTRLPISDGAYGRPWVFRPKDLVGWWSNAHVERVGGVEVAVTAWSPRSKPIWLTEIGVPAVDKGANGPNVFPDPKSSESAAPPFSRGTRDDLMQARTLEAILSRFDASLPGHQPSANPVSPLYGGAMVDPTNIFVWAWDARPYPAFPDFDLVWSDGRNWETGHWITGRLEGAALDRLIRAILAEFELAPADEIVADGVWRASDGGGFRLQTTVTLPAIAGRTWTALPPGPLWRWDLRAVLDIEIGAGTLSSVDDAAALAGDNVFAVQGPDARWEIIAAARAELTGERTYPLSRLLRGLAGSEPETARSVPAGARIVRLDDAVTPLTSALGDLGILRRYRIGPASRDHADPSFAEIATSASGDALRPLAPVHVAARREAGGVRIAWIRRSRRDADAWEPADVPLGEDGERYEIDILQGGGVVRRLAATTPEVLYPAAVELANFGAPQATLSLTIAQLGRTIGRGFARTVGVRVT